MCKRIVQERQQVKVKHLKYIVSFEWEHTSTHAHPRVRDVRNMSGAKFTYIRDSAEIGFSLATQPPPPPTETCPTKSPAQMAVAQKEVLMAPWFMGTKTATCVTPPL